MVTSLAIVSLWEEVGAILDTILVAILDGHLPMFIYQDLPSKVVDGNLSSDRH